MNKKDLIVLSLLFSTISFGATSCGPKKTDLFFSELYNGSSIDDCVLELGTKSEDLLNLSDYKVNFYDSKDIVYTHSFTYETISRTKLVLFVNDYSNYTNNDSTIIKLDNNYICGRFYVELVDSKNNVIDSLGNKTIALDYVRDGSLIRLNEYQSAREEFSKLDFIKFKSSYIENLGKLECPVTLDDVLYGPTLDESLYGYKPFSINNESTGGYCEVTIGSLGDGDTTYFIFPEGSGIKNDYDSRVRYLLINTPEIDHGPGSSIQEEPFGQEAKKFNNEKLNNATSILVQSCINTGIHDTYSRTLGFVWYATKENPSIKDYKLLNYEILLNGLARKSDGKYPDMHSNNILYEDYLNYALEVAMSKNLNIYGL